MNDYRCYFLNSQDRIVAVEIIQADRLEAAIDHSLTLLGQRPGDYFIELWDGALRLYASREQPPRHQCYVYEGAPSKILPAMAALIDQKLKENIRCLYLNSPAMIVGLKYYLTAAGIDVEHQVSIGALSLSCDQNHLVDGRFDPGSMLAMLEESIDQALSDGYKALWASGDMTWEIGPHCTAGELLEYEWRLEEIFRRRSEISGICQYHADTMARDLVRHGLAAHRSIFINETLTRINPHYLVPFGASIPHPELGDMIDSLCGVGGRPW